MPVAWEEPVLPGRRFLDKENAPEHGNTALHCKSQDTVRKLITVFSPRKKSAGAKKATPRDASFRSPLSPRPSSGIKKQILSPASMLMTRCCSPTITSSRPETVSVLSSMFNHSSTNLRSAASASVSASSSVLISSSSSLPSLLPQITLQSQIVSPRSAGNVTAELKYCRSSGKKRSVKARIASFEATSALSTMTTATFEPMYSTSLTSLGFGTTHGLLQKPAPKSKSWSTRAMQAQLFFFFVLHMMDVSSDIALLIRFGREGQTAYALISALILFTAFFVHASAMIGRPQLSSLRHMALFACHFGQLYPCYEAVQVLFYPSFQSFRPSYMDPNINFFEATLESLPQCLLQSYIVLCEGASPLLLFSLSSSFVSIALTLAQFEQMDSKHRQVVDYRQVQRGFLSCRFLSLLFVRYAETMTRCLLLALAATVVPLVSTHYVTDEGSSKDVSFWFCQGIAGTVILGNVLMVNLLYRNETPSSTAPSSCATPYPPLSPSPSTLPAQPSLSSLSEPNTSSATIKMIERNASSFTYVASSSGEGDTYVPKQCEINAEEKAAAGDEIDPTGTSPALLSPPPSSSSFLFYKYIEKTIHQSTTHWYTTRPPLWMVPVFCMVYWNVRDNSAYRGHRALLPARPYFAYRCIEAAILLGIVYVVAIHPFVISMGAGVDAKDHEDNQCRAQVGSIAYHLHSRWERCSNTLGTCSSGSMELFSGGNEKEGATFAMVVGGLHFSLSADNAIWLHTRRSMLVLSFCLTFLSSVFMQLAVFFFVMKNQWSDRAALMSATSKAGFNEKAGTVVGSEGDHQEQAQGEGEEDDDLEDNEEDDHEDVRDDDENDNEDDDEDDDEDGVNNAAGQFPIVCRGILNEDDTEEKKTRKQDKEAVVNDDEVETSRYGPMSLMGGLSLKLHRGGNYAKPHEAMQPLNLEDHEMDENDVMEGSSGSGSSLLNDSLYADIDMDASMYDSEEYDGDRPSPRPCSLFSPQSSPPALSVSMASEPASAGPDSWLFTAKKQLTTPQRQFLQSVVSDFKESAQKAVHGRRI